MSVAIRLRREGNRNRPYYKVVVTDKRSPRDGKFIELVGTYDPITKEGSSTLKVDRIEHWVSQGAVLSDTVKDLLRKKKKAAPAA